MANAATPPTSPASLKGTANPSGYDQFVDSRIAKTRTAVKSADVATGIVALIAWALVVLLVAAVADHWIVAGGLDRWERYALWGVGLAGAGLYVATRLGPNLWRSVNPLYAARELERETPELKNSLLNLLQLRGATDAPAIKQALERQAAERLARAGDAPIDHTPLVRAAKWLLALVAMVGVYVVASPKDFFASAGRVLAPWSQIAAPSRVRITAVEPGAVTLAQGERLEVSAMVSGLDADELVELVYTSDDRQAVGRRVPMTASSGGMQFSASLPGGSGATSALGLQGGLTYRIEAGDAHSANYQVEVLTAPTIAPVMVRYEYPPYTGYQPREVEGVGDLRAIEGTRVTMSVEANLPIESAQIDLGADGRPDVRMTAEGKTAKGTLALRHEGDGATSTNNYVLRFTSTDGQANHDPPQYQVEVLRDLAPEASIREPEAESIDVALNQRVRIAIEARDPDYALKRVRLVGEVAGKQVFERDLLRGDGKGGFKAETEIVSQAIGLRPGDVMDYWVEATDSRTPQPNVSQSRRHQLHVIATENPQQGDRRNEQQQPGAGGDPQQDQPPGDPNAEGQNGAQQQDGGPRQPNQTQPNQDQQGEQQQPGEAGENGQQDGQAKSQAGEEENQQGENGQPPPGGLTGPGNESGANSSEQSGDGNEGSSTSQPNEGENTPAGGSQAGQQSDDQQQPSGNQSGDQNGQNGNQQPAGQQPSGDPAQPPSASESSQGEGAAEQPVARDGSDDGSAFDKMLDWLKNQQGGQQDGESAPSDQKNQGGNEDGQAAQDAQPSNAEQAQDDGQAQDGQPRGEQSQPDPSEGQLGQAGDEQGQASDQKGTSGDQRDASNSEDEGGQQDANPSSDDQDTLGESNGRQGERGNEGSGGAEGEQQPRDSAGGEQPDRNNGPGAGEQDRRGEQSSSKSSESGGDNPPGESTDRDAGPREGADGAGQSQAADRGAGQSADKGAGDTSGREGGEQASDSPTGGESGDERGEGSQSRESQNGDGEQSGAGDQQQGGKQPGDEQSGEPSGQSPEGREGESGQQPGGESSESGDAEQNSDQQNSLDDKRGEGARDSSNPAGRGGPMELGDRGATSDAAGEGAESGGDAANLDYAREQTELVLQRLEDQLRKKEVDRKLLDKLGWTEEDLREFVDRWQSRKQKAAERGADGEAELDRALRSLGLSPQGPTAKSKVTEDSFRDLRENARGKTPARLRDSVEWYLRSINAADDAPASDE
ncbi:hypothetical protein [Botrimarina mediterranea]|uniref:hypothetical protein n=1 Tax=Botrimarina mediterranea TaxID=2528022 RepID=UPI00118B9BB8|nr:hypothetical protein K2D_38100 [Planctomycetes bacterium K2D]